MQSALPAPNLVSEASVVATKLSADEELRRGILHTDVKRQNQ